LFGSIPGRDPPSSRSAIARWRPCAPGSVAVARARQPSGPACGSRAAISSTTTGDVEVESLAGSGELRYLVTVPGGRELERLRLHLRERTGEAPSSRTAPYLYLGDQVISTSGAPDAFGPHLGDLRRLSSISRPTAPPAPSSRTPAAGGPHPIAVTDSTGSKRIPT
jgi:hypothetical protein